jgi:hypothetical protein
MIKNVSPDHIVAVTEFGGIVATARRKGPGTIWNVFLDGHVKAGGTRNQPPHVRVSGRLPEPVQRRLVIAALTATTRVLDTPWIAK